MREWHLFRCQDKEESERWLSQLNLFTISDRLTGAFGGDVESAGISAIIVGQDRKYRIALNGVEKGAEIDRGSEVIYIKPNNLSKNQDKIFKQRLSEKGTSRAMPKYAVMVDVDSFQEDPPSVDPQDFVMNSHEQIFKHFQAALPPL